MGDETTIINITVQSFGQLAETIGRTQSITVQSNATIVEAITSLGIESWIENGITVAINGNMCHLESILSDGDELTLLPPVSGG
tara:strand:+ start:413 stop:664 length:252 start_codon:yes stop_codon:yes gene_type:complete